MFVKADKMPGALEKVLLFAEGPPVVARDAHEQLQVCFVDWQEPLRPFSDWQDPLRPVGLPQCLPQRSQIGLCWRAAFRW